ncbi:MAG: hypothetical protein V8Q36_02795 [Anaerotignum sp.]
MFLPPVRRFRLKNGDAIKGIWRPAREGEKFGALNFVKTVQWRSPGCGSQIARISRN